MSSLAHDGCPESRDGTHSCFFPEKKLHCWWWNLCHSYELKLKSILLCICIREESFTVDGDICGTLYLFLFRSNMAKWVCRYFGVRKLRHIFYEKCVPIKKHIFNLLVETSPSSSDQDLLMSSQQLRSHADKIHQFSQWTDVSVKPTGWITTIFISRPSSPSQQPRR